MSREELERRRARASGRRWASRRRGSRRSGSTFYEEGRAALIAALADVRAEVGGEAGFGGLAVHRTASLAVLERPDPRERSPRRQSGSPDSCRSSTSSCSVRPAPVRGPRASGCRRTSTCRTTPPATSSAPRSARAPTSGSEAKDYMDRGDLVPDDVIVGVIAERIARARGRGRLHPRRLPAHRAAGRGAGREAGRARPRRVGGDPDRGRRGGGRAPARRAPHLPQRATSSTSTSTRPRRRASATSAAAARGPRRRPARGDPQPPRPVPREDRAADRVLRVARTAEAGRRRSAAGGGHRPDPGAGRHTEDGGGACPRSLCHVSRRNHHQDPRRRSSRWRPPGRSRLGA